MQMQVGRQPFKVKLLRTLEDVQEYGPFLTEGWQALKDPSRARCDIDLWDFFQRVVYIACGPKEAGAVIVFLSKNNKPLGFMVLQDNSESLSRRTVLIYAGYSNGRYAGAPEASIEYVEKWAREQGYHEVQAQSRRINGAAMRLFKRKLGFSPVSMTFRKAL